MEKQSGPKGLDLKLDIALEWAKNWRSSNDYDHTALHGIHVSKFDLDRMKDQEADGARFYLGIDQKGDAKVMVVGTKWNPETGTYDDMLPEMEHEGKVYDFSMPCPKACSSKSPFNDIK